MALQGGPPGGPGPQGGHHDGQISTVTLRAESKIFFVDLKENARGLYVKISERGLNRERSTIVVPPAGVFWFVALLDDFVNGGPSVDGQANARQCHVESKVFYFEAGENSRGRFLRISESCPGTRGNSSLIVPSGGADCSAWSGLRDALERMRTLHLADEPAAAGGLAPSGLEEQQQQQQQLGGLYPEPQRTRSPTRLDVAGLGQHVGPGPSAPTIGRTRDGHQVLRVGHKRFFFDLGSNSKGDFLRITETVGAERMSIIVPGAALEQFAAALQECVVQQQQQQQRGQADA